MSRPAKTLEKVLSGRSDANIKFADLCSLLIFLGFVERIRGDHHIFTHEAVVEILNLQPRGADAKPYQVRQVRNVITSYGLAGDQPATEGTADGD
jgi:hypothetical protein